MRLRDRIRIWWAGEKAVWAASAELAKSMQPRRPEKREGPWKRIRQRARADEQARLEERRS